MEKQTLHSDKYLDVYYSPDLRLIEYYWKKATEEMSEAEYRMVIWDMLDIVEGKGWRPEYYLLDNRDFLFTMFPKLQEWQVKYPMERSIKLGAKKAAVIMSEDFVSQVSIEQTFEEGEEGRFILKYFSSTEAGKEWLLDKKELV